MYRLFLSADLILLYIQLCILQYYSFVYLVYVLKMMFTFPCVSVFDANVAIEFVKSLLSFTIIEHLFLFLSMVDTIIIIIYFVCYSGDVSSISLFMVYICMSAQHIVEPSHILSLSHRAYGCSCIYLHI